mgnify:CR=1 FL=1
MNTVIDKPAIDFTAIKQRQQATWASGDYATIGTTLQIVGETLAEAADVRAGQAVLDVAAGNGNASLAAARRYAKVTSTDYVQALLDKGRARAQDADAIAEILNLIEDVRREEDRLAPCGGKSAVTDGPYAEAKELVGGFFIIEAADREEAVRVASPESSLTRRYGESGRTRSNSVASRLSPGLGRTTSGSPCSAGKRPLHRPPCSALPV